MSDTERIVSQLYIHWKQGDLAGASALMADDFCYMLKVPGDIHPLGGVCHGRDTAMARLGAILQSFDMIDYTADPLLVNGERAATEAHIHYRDRASGEELKTTLAHFWHVRGGKVAKLVEYHDIDTMRDFAARVAAKG